MIPFAAPCRGGRALGVVLGVAFRATGQAAERAVMKRLAIRCLRAILRKLDPPQPAVIHPFTGPEVNEIREIADKLRGIGIPPIAGHASCTAERCSLKYHHSPCRYQTALAAKFAAELDKPKPKVRKKATGRPALKATKKRVRG